MLALLQGAETKEMDTRLIKIKEYSQAQLANETTGHDYYHALRVAKAADAIIAAENDTTVDGLVVSAAAFLHDIVDDKVAQDVVQAQKDLKDFLKTLTFTAVQLDLLEECIYQTSFSYELDHPANELSSTAKVFQDADRLDALGAVGIMRTAYFGGAHKDPLYDPKRLPKKLLSKADYRAESTVITHFYEKLFLLPELMNTAYGRSEGQRRKEFMEGFLAEFFQEWPEQF